MKYFNNTHLLVSDNESESNILTHDVTDTLDNSEERKIVEVVNCSNLSAHLSKETKKTFFRRLFSKGIELSSNPLS